MEPDKFYSIILRLDDDSLIERRLNPVQETIETDNLTIYTAFEVVPPKWSVFSFGEINKVVKPFSVVSITRSQELRRKITAIEYIEEIYTDSDVIPQENISALVIETEVRNLNIAEETYRQKDGTVISNINCSWKIGRDHDIHGIEIEYPSDNGHTWTRWGSTNRNAASISGV